MFLNWENIDLDSEDKKQDSSLHSLHRTKPKDNTISQENERKRITQLRKLQLHKDDNENKKDYITAMTKFGEFLMNKNLEEIGNTLLAEDCEIFLFNFAEVSPAQYEFTRQGFIEVLKGYQIKEREIKETCMDLMKTTGFQICFWIIRNEAMDSTISQFSFESFSFQDKKISKYRGVFGCASPMSAAHSLFGSSRKASMFAKVKEINYALADQPNLQKIAALLHENTEYRIWRWKDKKGFTFNQKNLASEFRKSLEEDFVIKSIVPFDPTIEAQYILGSYVYYLEGKGELCGQKYQWVSTCIYAFDWDLNITKMSQQGELYEEDEILLPFEVHSEENIREKIEGIYTVGKDTQISIIDSTQEVQFSFDLGIFTNSDSPGIVIKGLNDYKKYEQKIASGDQDFELLKPIDIYLGCDDPCYDIAITTDYSKGTVNNTGKNHKYYGKLISLYGMRKYSFENGRVAKAVIFILPVPEPLPSPYDDTNFIDHNVKSKHEFL